MPGLVSRLPHIHETDTVLEPITNSLTQGKENALDMEEKLSGPYYEKLRNSPSRLWPSVAALPGLAASIFDVNESFIASKFLLRSYLISVHDDTTLGFDAWRVCSVVFLRSVCCCI